jgi:ketosteroid isomerase-like protein
MMHEIPSETLEAKVESLSRQVAQLLDRQAILDVILHWTRALDRRDREMLLETFHPDAIDDHGAFIGNREEFCDMVFGTPGNERRFSHHLAGNHTVEIDGDVAHAETYVIGSIVKDGTFMMVGGRYIDKLVKENGRWSILRRVLVTDWGLPTTGRVAVDGNGTESWFAQFSPEARLLAETRAKTRRDKLDASYRRPLEIDEQRLKSRLG